MWVWIYVRYIWGLRTEVAARSRRTQAHTHTQAHLIHKNTKSTRSAQLLSDTRRTPKRRRCERVEPTKANESSRAQHSAQKYSAQCGRAPTAGSDDPMERARVSYALGLVRLHSYIRTHSLSLSQRALCVIYFQLVFSCALSKQTFNQIAVCLWNMPLMQSVSQHPERARVGCFRLFKNVRSIDRMSFIATASPLTRAQWH